jgi:hypothetical protein
LDAEVSFPCGTGNDFHFSWTRRDFNGPSVSLNLPTSVSRNLYIPANTFSANSAFQIQITVSVNNDNSLLGKDLVTIYVDPPVDFAILSTAPGATDSSFIVPYARTISRLSELDLDASGSIYNDASTDATFFFDQLCSLDVVNPSNCDFCVDDETKALYWPTNSSSVTIPPATLQPGNYSFGVTVTDKSGRQDSVTLDIQILGTPAPDVNIAPVSGPRVNRQDKLTIGGFATSLTGGALSYLWTVEPSEYLDLTNPDNLISTNQDAVLVIRPNVLFDFVTYSFTLTATDEAGNVGSASIQITVNPPPRMGSVGKYNQPL